MKQSLKNKKWSNRVLILSQYYPPETGAPQNRLSDLAVRFQRAGYDTRVLTAKPNYPIGKIYPGYEKGFSQTIVLDGVQVTYCWIYASNKSLFRRLMNYFSFVFSSIIVGITQLPKMDVLIMESPPLFLTISGWLLSRIKGAKLILNISDLYPETAISLGILKNKSLIRIFYWLEAWSYKISTLITGQTKGIITSISTRFPNKRVYLLTNGMNFEVLQELIVEDITVETKHEDDFIVGYAGVIGYGQNLQILTTLAATLRTHPNIKFHVYGDGPEKNALDLQINRLFLTNLTLFGHYPHSEILKIMQQWDVGLVSLADKPLMSGALPSKMFEMMALRLPILLIAPQGEASTIIDEASAGIWVAPQSEDRISDAILTLYTDNGYSKELGENGYRFVKEKYNRKLIFEEFVAYLLSQGIVKKD